MIQQLLEALNPVLACPYCLGSLQASPDGLDCSGCQTHYPFIGNTQVDLRLQRPKPRVIEFEVGTSIGDATTFEYAPLESNPRPGIDFGDQPVPSHFTKELRSHVPRDSSRGTRPGFGLRGHATSKHV